jgi:hypothetical protein
MSKLQHHQHQHYYQHHRRRRSRLRTTSAFIYPQDCTPLYTLKTARLYIPFDSSEAMAAAAAVACTHARSLARTVAVDCAPLRPLYILKTARLYIPHDSSGAAAAVARTQARTHAASPTSPASPSLSIEHAGSHMVNITVGAHIRAPSARMFPGAE